MNNKFVTDILSVLSLGFVQNYYNPCLDCDCYDPDMGCTMPSLDLDYACSLHCDEVIDDEK